MRIRTFILTLATTAAVLAGTALGQVQQRDGGYALDASPQVGSNGRNAGAGNDLGDLLKSNLYVTGQVSGYGAVRADIPYRPLNEFRIDLPSGSLADFNRRSVGLQDVLRGNTYQTQPYFAPSQTALGAGGIISGKNALGTNAPLDTRLDRSRQYGLFQDALSEYQNLAPNQAGRALSAPLYVPVQTSASPGLVPGLGEATPRVLSTTGGYESSAQPMFPASGVGGASFWDADPSARPGTGALFGVLDPLQRQRLARDLQRLREPESALNQPLDASLREQYRLGGEQSFRVDASVSAAVPLRPSDVDDAREERERFEAIRRNEDTFVDLMLRLRDRSGDKEPAIPQAPQGGQGANIVERLGDDVVLHQFSGVGKSEVNRYLAEGEADLRKGRYYQAVEWFRLANMVDPSNPLSVVGMGVAYAGAGEMYTAGLQFHQALRQFPPLMETRFDLGKLIEEQRIRDELARLSLQLRQEVYQKHDVQLYLAGAWLARSLGEDAEAQRYARRLLEAKPDDQVLIAYATYLIEGKRPTTQPATQPAE